MRRRVLWPECGVLRVIQLLTPFPDFCQLHSLVAWVSGFHLLLYHSSHPTSLSWVPGFSPVGVGIVDVGGDCKPLDGSDGTGILELGSQNTELN